MRAQLPQRKISRGGPPRDDRPKIDGGVFNSNKHSLKTNNSFHNILVIVYKADVKSSDNYFPNSKLVGVLFG